MLDDSFVVVVLSLTSGRYGSQLLVHEGTLSSKHNIASGQPTPSISQPPLALALSCTFPLLLNLHHQYSLQTKKKFYKPCRFSLRRQSRLRHVDINHRARPNKKTTPCANRLLRAAKKGLQNFYSKKLVTDAAMISTIGRGSNGFGDLAVLLLDAKLGDAVFCRWVG